MKHKARLIGIGTAVPPFELSQATVREVAGRILSGQVPDYARLSRAFDNAGITTRYAVVPLDWFEKEQGWATRTGAYLEGATRLFVDAARAALAASAIEADEVDTVITVSSTGIATPTLEARAMASLGFRRDIRRIPVFGLGCAGGVTGLSLAARLATSAPGERILMVAVETCTLAFRSDRHGKADIIATVLFGDGAAAACVSAGDGHGPVLGQGQEFTWPDTLAIMGWDVDDFGLGVIFDRSIPVFTHRFFADAVQTTLARAGLHPGDADRLLCHPGGVKVIEAIEGAMNYPPGTLDHERTVLRDFGNMSAPTALFVLDRYAATRPRGQTALVALGPGFTLSMLPVGFGADP